MQITIIDPQDKKYENQLNELVRSIEIPGFVSYVYERNPFSTLSKAQGEKIELWSTLDDDNQVLGITQLATNYLYWNGKSVELSYSGESRVHPRARGLKVGIKMFIAAMKDRRTPVIGVVLGTNKVVLEKKIPQSSSLGVEVKIVGEMRNDLFTGSHNPVKLPEGYSIVPATKHDLPEMFALWQKLGREYSLVKYFPDLDSFSKDYEKTPGVSLSETYLVKDESLKIIAFASFWDQRSFRKIRIRNVHWLGRALRPLILPFFPLPKPGDELKTCYMFHPCVSPDKKELGWKILLDHFRYLVTNKDFDLLATGIDPRDPIEKMLKKYSKLSNYAVVTLQDPFKVLDSSKPKLLYFDVGLG